MADPEVPEVPEADADAEVRGRGRHRHKQQLHQPRARAEPEPEPETRPRMRTAADVIQRIKWDASIPEALVVVGYMDRFEGLQERAFGEFNFVEPAMAALHDLNVPEHRIQHFRLLDAVLWSKPERVDRIFCSTENCTPPLDDILRALPADAAPEVLPPPGGDPDAAAAAGPAAAAKKPKNQDRPNFFVCLKIDDPQVLANVAALQGRVVARAPELEEAVQAPSRMHITLVMLRIDSTPHLLAAQRVVHESRALLRTLLRAGLPLSGGGVTCFRDRVLVARPADCSGVDALAYAVRERMRVAGVQLAGNHDPFTAHMTLLKLSRALCRSLGAIPRAAYADELDAALGAQPGGGAMEMHLCPVGRPADPEAFYETLTEAAAAAPPEPEPPADELAKLTAAVGPGHAVVLRGLPGAGKSTVVRAARRLLEARGVPVVVCRADAFFLSPRREYRFQPSLLGEAHAACAERALAALAAGDAAVFVDNTHSTLAEYARVRAAAAQLHVWEVPCADRQAVRALFQRCAHPVPLSGCLEMFDRWEADAEAVVLSSPSPVAVSQGDDQQQVEAVLLDARSRVALLDAVPPLLAQELGDRVTLRGAGAAGLPLGAAATVTVTGCRRDGPTQTALVRVAVADVDLADQELVVSTGAGPMAEPQWRPVELRGTVARLVDGRWRTACAELHVYDFDGTLMMTPDVDAAGLADPASVAGAHPGPALAALVDDEPRAVVLTGRRDSPGMRAALRAALPPAAAANVVEWVLRPAAERRPTPEWKAAELQRLMAAQGAGLRRVVVHEDRPECAAALAAVDPERVEAVLCQPRPAPPSVAALQAAAALRGAAVTAAFRARAEAAVARVARAWAPVGGTDVVLRSGSAALGRRGDQDVVLLMPAAMTHAQAVRELAARLERDPAVRDVYAAPLARCPRVAALLDGGVEVDVSFCRFADEPTADLRGLNAQLADDDERSLAAFMGPLRAASALRRAPVPPAEFAAAVEHLMAALAASGLRGGLCPRPFQMVEAALACAPWDSFHALLDKLAALSFPQWARLLCPVTPETFVVPLMECLGRLASLVSLGGGGSALALRAAGGRADVAALLEMLVPPPVSVDDQVEYWRVVAACPAGAGWAARQAAHADIAALVGVFAKQARTVRPVSCRDGRLEMLVERTSRMKESRVRSLVAPFCGALSVVVTP